MNDPNVTMARRLGHGSKEVVHGSLPSLVWHFVVTQPSAPAIVSESLTLSYEDLWRASGEIANELRVAGLGAGHLVAIESRRGAEVVAAMLGVLRSGAAYLMVDPTFPAQRQAALLGDADASVLLGIPGDGPQIVASIPRLDLDRSWLRLATSPGRGGLFEPEASDPSDPMYMVYTSGSTGVPKGVIVPHSGVAGLVSTALSTFGIGPGSRVLQFASPTFDASFWEISMAIGTGAALHVPPDELRNPDIELFDYIANHGIDVAGFPPSFLEAAGRAVQLPRKLQLLSGGERVPASVAAFWSTRVRFFN